MNIRKIDSIILEVLDTINNPLVEEQSESANDRIARTKQREKELEKLRAGTSSNDIESGLDIFQTILDWAGFIPGYGDIIDAINAIIYFYRGKTIEGYLSLIAVVPIVGSALKLGFKGAIQSIGGAIAFSKILKQAKAGNITGLADFYKVALDSGNLSKVQLSKLADYGDEVAKLLVSGKSNISKLEQALKLDPASLRSVYKQIDDMAVLVKNTTSIPVRQSLTSTGGKLIQKGVKNLTKGAGKLATGTLNLATFGGFGIARNLVKKLGFGPKELKQLRKAMDVKFVKQVEQSPLLTTSLFKQLKRPNAATSVGELGVPPWLYSRQTKDIDEWFDNLKKTDPLKWKLVSNNIAKASMSVENPYYIKMASNYFQQAKNIFSPGAVYTASKGNILPSLTKLDTYRLSNPKNLDIVANEIEDLAEKIGLDPQDDPNGVILSALYLSVMELVKDYEEYIPSAIGVAGAAAAVTDTVGLTNFGAAGGEDATAESPGQIINVSPELTKIKNDFKEAQGTTTERLDALQQKGYTDQEILKLKQELDID
jgi:hypothetical protein